MDRMEALRRIVEADREARARIDEARHEKESFQTRLETLSRELDEAAMSRAREEAETARRQADAALARQLDELDRAHETTVRQLRTRLAGAKDALTEALFRAAVGPE